MYGTLWFNNCIAANVILEIYYKKAAVGRH